MNALDLAKVRVYVNENITDFHDRRIQSLARLRLDSLLQKNPYLFRAKNITTAHELISGLLEAFLSLSEEKLFGDFLENLAIFVAEQTCNGHKSAAPGIDLELLNQGIHYLISIKSGPHWGNSSQYRRLEADFKEATIRVKQSQRGANVQPVLGICCGKSRTTFTRGYLKVMGQNFWTLISGDPGLYAEIIEPVGHRAKEHNDTFLQQKGSQINLLSKQFLERFCSESGAIDWIKLVEFNSRNYDLDHFLPEKDQAPK